MTNAVSCTVSNNLDIPCDPRLPKEAYLPINHCNLPAAILGGLTFQRHPNEPDA